jgi:hypothetical protein
MVSSTNREIIERSPGCFVGMSFVGRPARPVVLINER